MAGQRPSRSQRPKRALAPLVEGLDSRMLLSAGAFGTGLGHFVAPGRADAPPRGRALRPAQTVDAHRALNRALVGFLGPGLDRIERQVEFNGTTAPDSLSERVLAQPFVHAVFRNNDTFTLLGSPALAAVLTSQELAPADPDAVVTLELPRSRLQQVGDPSLIQVQPGDPAPGGTGATFENGFIVQVPSSAIVITPNDTILVDVPLSQIPEAARQLTNSQQNFLGPLYRSTGALLLEAFRSGVQQGTPASVGTVPGLRLPDALRSNRLFPSGGSQARFFRMMRTAVDRKLLSAEATQTDAFDRALDEFLGVVNAWGTTSTAQFDALRAARPGPELVPPLPSGSLAGTFAVSAGVVRPNSAALPERIEVGYVFARNGDFGLILSARGPLSTTVPSAPSGAVVGGDIQAEVSNAADLGRLEGWRIVEGIYQGSVLSGGLESTNEGGVATLGTSAGYGAGLEYGLGIRYTKVIPLGNVSGRPIA